MHRIIFIATFLPAVFLVDLFASSASIPEEPLSVGVQIAANVTVDNGVSTATTVDNIPRIAPGAVKKEKAAFQCSDELYLFMLDHIRETDDRANGSKDEHFFDDYISREGISNCDQLFLADIRYDLNGDGEAETIVKDISGCCSSARSDLRTWVVQKTNNSFRVLLSTGLTAWVDPESKKVRKYSVLSAHRHYGGDRFLTASYEYRNGMYRLSKCSSWKINDDKINREKLSDCEQ